MRNERTKLVFGAAIAPHSEGYGVLLLAEAQITFAVHFHKEGAADTAALDNSQEVIQFKNLPVTHPVQISTARNCGFEAPAVANNFKAGGGGHVFSEDNRLLAMMPHMNLRGKTATYTAYYPDGTSEVLLNMPAYYFNWQSYYEYAVPRALPAGTRLEMELVSDNSHANADRVGADPAKSVHCGGPNSDELDLAWITIAPKTRLNIDSAAGDDASD